MPGATLLDSAVPESAVPIIRVMRSGGRGRAVHHGRAASENRIRAGVGSAAVGDRAAARRRPHPREQTGPDLASSLLAGETVVLVHGGQSELAPTAQGGTGKTQLAVEFAHAMWNTRAVEVLVWVTGASSESIIAGFAQAANTVDASRPDEGAEMAADRFMSWLARTRRPWALIIDDLAELSDLEELWPAGPVGRVLITTRLPATAFGGPPFDGAALPGRDLRIIPVAGLSRREALDYVASRLTDHPDQRIEALDLGEDLDGLPLGLAQATAVMSARRQGCREYRALLAERIGHMPAADGGSAAVLATWSIAAECAHELPPAGLAWPTLVLAAMLDHHGVPGAVLTSPAACGYIAGRPSTANGADRNMVRAAINNLARAGLVTIDPASPARTVHERTVADSGRMLGPAHPVTLDARVSLAEAYQTAGRPADAIAAYELLLADAGRQLGAGHPATLGTRARLGAAYATNGQAKEAIAQYGRALADQERIHGRDHPDTIAARASLASAFRVAGKQKDAIAQYEQVLADRERVQGGDHPDAIAACANLAFAYRSVGRLREAVPLYERTFADRMRVQGQVHRDTLTARSNLAACYQQARRMADAIPHYERALADSERMLGAGDMETLTTRCNLASACYTAGRLSDVVAVLQRALTDCERYLGPDDQMTQTVRENLDAATQA